VAVVLHLLGDDDARVREAAAGVMGRLVPRLFFPSDWPGPSFCALPLLFECPLLVESLFSFYRDTAGSQSPLVAVVERKASIVTGKAAGENDDRFDPIRCRAWCVLTAVATTSAGLSPW
jgi:hypothetical protein